MRKHREIYLHSIRMSVQCIRTSVQCIQAKTTWLPTLNMPLQLFQSERHKNQDYRTNWIEQNTSRTSLFDVYLAIFTHFLRFSNSFFIHPINLKALVAFYIFQRLIHIFKDDFTKFQDNSRTKGNFSNFRSFPRPRSNSKTFPGLCEPCRMSNKLDPDQAGHFGAKLFAKVISRQQKVKPGGQQVKEKTTYWYYFLAKTLAKVSFTTF